MIQRATVADAKEISDLVNSAYRGDSSREGWTTEADLLDGSRTDAELIEKIIGRPGATILKYTDGNKIIACVELDKRGEELYLGMLTVQPRLQGKGIGKELLKTVEAEAKSLGCTSIMMTVISVRKELIAWYVRCGYEDTGKKKPFEFTDDRWGIPRQPIEFIVMKKRLVIKSDPR